MPHTPEPPLSFLSGGGELGALIRAHDWSATPLGPADAWPQSLKTILGVLLQSRYPMFVFWGPQLIKIYNDAYRPVTGRKHPWALGQPAEEVWPEIWSDIKPLVDRALAGDPTWSDDLMLVMERNGFPEEVYFTFSYSPIPDESGGIGGMFCACTETTGKVLGERRLRVLRDLAAAPADTRKVGEACTLSADVLRTNSADLPFALIYLSDSGSPHLAAHTGAGTIPERSIGNALSDIVREVAQTGQAQRITALPQLLDPVPAGPWPEPPSSAMILPLVARGIERGVGSVVLGISSRRPFDDEYREWFGLIAHQIGTSIANARAAEEEHRRIEALAELDRAKTTFFSNVSHELRTPLTLMLGPVAEALGDASTTPAVRDHLVIAQRNGLRLLKLVNSLLDFSRVEAGRTEASYHPTDLSQLTADLAALFRSAIESAGLRLIVDCPPIERETYVDREMWEKVVLNLLSNAFKHTFEGEIAVTLRDRGDHAELEVRDTGTGIPASELPRLFERFHRVESAQARTHEGTGIGLALVHELVKLHGGSVAVQSTEGRGSAFTISIPFGSAHLPPASLRAGAPRAAPAASAYVEEALRWLPAGVAPAASEANAIDSDDSLARMSANRGGRIVLADDNADMRDYVYRLLSPYWDVEAVADGQAAIAVIERQKPDLVITDIMMPRVDGLQLLAAIRASNTYRDLPVIMLSARAGEDARLEGLQAGADDYLVKPFGGPELIARVSAALRLASVRREGEDRLSAVNRDLRHRVAELEALLSVIPVGIGIAFDRECRDIQINEAFASTLGIATGSNASMTAPAGERPTVFKVLDQNGREVPGDQLPMQRAARQGHVTRELELDIVHDDGRVVRLLEFATPLFDERGEPRGAVGAFIDITERRRAELRDQLLLRIDDTLRMATDPPAMLRTVTRIIAEHFNASRCFFAELTGDPDVFTVESEYRSNDATPSMTGRHPLPGPDTDLVRELRARRTVAIADSLADSRHVPALSGDDQAHPVRAVAVTPVHRAGRWISNLVVGCAAAREWGKDEIALLETVAARSALAAERLRLNAALRESNERARLALEIARVGAWSFDPVRDIVTADARTREICFLDPDLPLDLKTVVGHMNQDDWPAVEAALQEALRPDSDGRFSVEARFSNSSGVTHWIVARGQTQFVTNDAGERQPSLLLGSVLDITDRVQIEADLRSTNRMKDEFLATLSHELRTPLNAVLGWAHMLRTGTLREDVARRAFESLERNARAQAQLVDDLLDVSRIISGKLQIHSEEVALSLVISSAMETIQPTAISRQVSLQFHPDDDNPIAVMGDVDRLRQVVWNLLSNAVKFTPQGGRVDILLRRSGRSYAEIVIRDTGQGIEPSFLPFVFDRFRQADGTTTRRHGGLGLGLAIVRHLTEAHGGTVEADSDGPDRGATFTIRLPLANKDRLGVQPFATDGRESDRALVGTRVLVVDDELDSRELLRAILESHGAEVLTVESAGAAVHAIEAGAHDVVLADVGMPEEDGYALIRAVRALPGSTAAIPAIAVTAYANPQARSQAAEAGFGWHLSKPVEPDTLVETVRKAVANGTNGT